MTYCVAIRIDAGLCFVSDSRTNAGVDNISTYSKMYSFEDPGRRQLVVLSSGNLATTQGVIAQVKKDIKKRDSLEQRYRETLEAKPWQSCECAICQKVGVETIIFRGANRNRRRGFHNLEVYYNHLKKFI